MQRKTKGGLLGIAAFSVLAVISEVGGASDDGSAAESAAVSDASTPAGGRGEPSSTANRTGAPSQPAEATPTRTETAESAEGAEADSSQNTSDDESADLWTVVDVVDGDTINVTLGDASETVRIVGIDTPERGECGYDEATAALVDLVGGARVELTGTGAEDRDVYDRLLRYVDREELDAGFEQISAGMAIARYDSRDGYGRHPREDEYISTDEATGPGYACADVDSPPEPQAEPEPAPADGAEPWNQPGPDLDCGDIGQRVRITGEDYHGLDADGDGWGCDSYE